MVISDTNGSSTPPHDSDEISLFVRQLLHRSSSSSSLPSVYSGKQSSPRCSGLLDSCLQFPCRSVSSASYFPPGGSSNLSLSSAAPVESESITAGSVQLRSLENDSDDFNCESEERPEMGLEEVPAKQNPQRNSSKRSRAAEVHNLSEKRRRSRINEKMKALQNLIPNSNKTDKASMLDEAIEYLKQLQLQVQMLSLRNGLSLHPMCLPGLPGVLHPVQLSQMGLDFGNRGGSLCSSIANTCSPIPPHQRAPSTSSLHSLPGMMTSEAAFALESSMPNQLVPHDLLTSSQVRIEDGIGQHQLVMNNSETITIVSKFDSQPSYLKDGIQGVLQGGIADQAQLISSTLDGLYPETTSQNDSVARILTGTSN